jgi:hypothetical protein
VELVLRLLVLHYMLTWRRCQLIILTPRIRDHQICRFWGRL